MCVEEKKRGGGGVELHKGFCFTCFETFFSIKKSFA